jgi:large repetitive protein
MRRVGSRETRDPVDAVTGLRIGMSRFRLSLAVVAMTMTVVFTAGDGVANAQAPIAGGNITTVCIGTTTGTTFTLTQDCGAVTTSLTVPAGITTVDGGGHTISATDLNGADPTVHTPIPQFNGGIVTNATPGQPMNIQNVTITGPAAGFSLCGPQAPGADAVLSGIFFNGAAGGSVSNVTVQHIFQFQNGAFASCQAGRAIRADDSGTITITGTTVTDYQKSGFEARGSTIMNVSGSTAGPSHPLEGLIAQNGVAFVGAAGTVANNTIFGSGDAAPPPPGCSNCTPAAGTAVLLFGAHDVTVTNNTLTSPAAPRPGTDIGISVSAGSSTGIVISFNRVNRLGPDVPDTSGIGIDVFTPDGSNATLICNTFSQWITNVVGAEQIACTPLPNGCESQAYSAPAPAVDSGKNYQQTEPVAVIDATPFTWTVASGTLPPGLSLSSGGAITGTPTAAGTFNFTLRVVDSTGLTATQAQTITIAECAPPPTTTTPPTPPARARIDIDKRTRTRFARPGDLVTYRITVANRGDAPASELRACDRAPRALRFVRSTSRMRRAAARRRCVVISSLQPGQRRTFRVTYRLRANVTRETVTNRASAGGARDAATIGVRRAQACPAAANVRARAAC